jgi:hypothetical protein
MSGRGSVQTFIRVPYVVALIELEEGPVLISNVIGDGGLDVKVSDPVEVVYERISGDAALPQFRLAKGK